MSFVKIIEEDRDFEMIGVCLHPRENYPKQLIVGDRYLLKNKIVDKNHETFVDVYQGNKKIGRLKMSHFEPINNVQSKEEKGE